MKINKLVLLATGAMELALMTSTGFAQQRPRVEAGVSANLGLALGETQPLTVAIAKELVAAAKAATCSPPAGTCTGVFCVADGAGTLIYLEAIDGVLMGGPELCISKAETPVYWRRPTAVFEQNANSYAGGAYPHMTTSGGGVPIFKDGRCIGGVGIAAVGLASAQIDVAIVREATRIFGSQKPTYAGEVMRH